MKKSLLVFGVIAMMVHSLAFTSCEQPTDQTVTTVSKTELQTLPPPANVKATAYKESGVIRVTWDAVANAAAYDVYRRGGNASVQLVRANFTPTTTGTPDPYLVYDDTIGWNNELRAGESYVYKVVAKTNWSTNPAAATSNPWAAAGSQVTDPYSAIVQNSSRDSNAVSFGSLLPANSKLPSPKNLKVESLVVTDAYVTPYDKTEIIRASWEKAPGLNYLVRYSLGNEGTVDANGGYLAAITPSATEYLAVTAYQDLPIIRGGKINVEVIAYRPYTGAGTAITDVYYLPSDPAANSIEKLPALLAKPSISVGPNGSYGDVALAWTNPATADAYEIYRFITSSGTYTPVPTPGTVTGIIYNDWTNITNAIKASVRETAVNNLTGEISYAAVDSPGETAPGQYLYYAIVAKKGSAKSEAALSNAVTSQFTAAAPALSGWFEGGSISFANSNWWNGIANVPAKVVLQWNNNDTDGYTYKVYRAAAVSNGDTITGPVGNEWQWEELTSPITISDAGTSTATIYDAPPLRKAYRYKLVTSYTSYANTSSVTNAATVKTLESYTTLSEYPYQTNRVNISLSVNLPELPNPLGNKRGTAYQLEYKIDETDLAIYQLKTYILQDGEKVRISRNRFAGGYGGYASGDEGADFGQLRQIQKAELNNTSKWLEQNLSGYYDYRIEVIDAADKPLFNDYRTVAYNNSPGPSAGLTFTRQTGGVVTPGKVRLTVTGANSGIDAYLQGTKVYVKYVTGTTLQNAIDKFNNPAEAATTLELALKQDTVNADLYFTDEFDTSTPATNVFVYGAAYYRSGVYAEGISSLTQALAAGQF
jgi:hypothetical protein